MNFLANHSVCHWSSSVAWTACAILTLQNVVNLRHQLHLACSQGGGLTTGKSYKSLSPDSLGEMILFD